MGAQQLLGELVNVARKAGVVVRVEPLRTPSRSVGGLCRVAGRPMVILERKSGAVDRAWVIADALRRLGIPVEEKGLSLRAKALLLGQSSRQEPRRTRPSAPPTPKPLAKAGGRSPTRR